MPGVGLKINRILMWGVASLMIAAAPFGALRAQNEATLRQTFEGRPSHSTQTLDVALRTAR